MKYIKKALYVASAALAAAPLIVSAAGWDTGFSNAGSQGLPSNTITGLITQTLNWLLAILGFIAILGFVISGILYLTAYGDEKRVEKAKQTMIYSIIGIIVALVGFIVVRAVDAWLGGNSSF